MNADCEPLVMAFVHQSVSAAKNRVRAQKAALEGGPAPLFLALAQAQEVHAKKALMLLRGRIGSVSENLAEAELECRELAVDSLCWTVLAQAEGEKAAASLLIQMARTLSSHLQTPAGAEGDAEGQTYWVCGVCGHIHAAEPGGGPGRCPVCQAVPEKFSEVRA